MTPAAGWNHIAFRCRDRVALEAFYTKHFGFVRSRTFNRGQPDEFVMLKLGSLRLELFPSSSKSQNSQEASPVDPSTGFLHLAFDVPKLEPMLDALRADGVKPDPIIDVSHVIKGARIVFFRDPENNLIELMEGYRDEE